MRKLGLLDAFAVARIIKAANLQKEMADFGMEVMRRKAVRAAELKAEQIGVEAFVTIISKCANEDVERRVYELYASIKGAKPDEVKYYDLTTIREDFKELVELNNLKDFFALVSASMSKLRSS